MSLDGTKIKASGRKAGRSMMLWIKSIGE